MLEVPSNTSRWFDKLERMALKLFTNTAINNTVIFYYCFYFISGNVCLIFSVNIFIVEPCLQNISF